MPIFASEPATIVRQRSPWLPPRVAYGAIFLTIALAAYGWKYFGSRPPQADVPPQATAKVCIHYPNFAYQHAWQEILAQARTEIRENLHLATQQSGHETVVAISLSNLPGDTIVPMVNVVASAYLQACRAQWKLHLEQAYSAAEEKVRQTERNAFEAQTRFELVRDRRLRALANLAPVAPPQPATMENPRWTEICHRLADLEERRKVLLLERTPLHPSVQEIEMRIADVRREMASIPPKITQESPVVSLPSTLPPDAPAAAEVQAAQQVAEQLQQDLQQAQAIERAALTARGEELNMDLLAAESLPPPPAPPRATPAILGKALVTATTAVVGLGMISMGVSLEPVLSSISELQALLPAPIVGVIPAVHPGRRPPASALRRRLARWGWMTAGAAVLLAVAWLFVRG
ncbi:MAG: hypothetical protein ACLP9L_12460 [Thermoguttaceae bacterium]